MRALNTTEMPIRGNGFVASLPSDYRPGAAEALAGHGKLATRYLHYTQIGDRLADEVADALAELPSQEQARVLKALVNECAGRPDWPRAFANFADACAQEPHWYDRQVMAHGCRAFHRHSRMFLAAFVASVLVEGFCTYISKSFVITGRLRHGAQGRLQQNNRHLMAIFMPNGLDRGADGWKLSIRIRLVHAQVRRLLKESSDWDRAAWGIPVSAAHVAYAASTFSGLLLKRARMLGVKLDPSERAGFMQVFRYSAYLMGIPEDLLPEDEQTALRIYRAGLACEPPICAESKVLAHGLINSAPLLVGKCAPEERRRTADYIYKVSRAMIGNDLARRLGYPDTGAFGVLAALRLKNHFHRYSGQFFPGFLRKRRFDQFQALLSLSHHDRNGIVCRVPDHVYAERDRKF